MTTRGFSLLLIIGTVISWINFISVLVYIDPYKGGILGIIFFYISAIFALVGTLYLSGIVLRKKFVKYQPAFVRLCVAWRQAIWFTALLMGLVFMYQQDLLNLLNVALLIAVLLILEFFFISYKKEI